MLIMCAIWFSGSTSEVSIVLAINLFDCGDVIAPRPPLRLSNASNFFIAQTNYDHWQPDPPQDPRRTALERYLNEMGRELGTSKMGLFAAISTFPVHNPHTAYTAVMQADSGALTSFVRTSMYVPYLRQRCKFLM